MLLKDGSSEAGCGRSLSRLVLLILAALMAVPGLVAAQPQQQGDALLELGRIPVVSPPDRTTPLMSSVQILADPSRGLAFTFVIVAKSQALEVGVRTFPGGALIRTLRIDLPRHEPASGGFRYLFDKSRGWLIIPTYATNAAVPGTEAVSQAAYVPGDFRIFDVEELAAGRTGEIKRVQPGIEALNRRVWEMEFVEVGGRPKIRALLSSYFGSVGEPVVVQYDIETGVADWSFNVSVCAKGAGGGGTPFLGSVIATSVDGKRLYVVCSLKSPMSSVVRIYLDKNGAPDPVLLPEAYGAFRQVVRVFFDYKSERLGIVLSAGVAVFDGASSRLIGFSGGPGNIATALNQETGRLYGLNSNTPIPGSHVVQGGLQAMDIRTTPPGQFSLLAPELAYEADQEMFAVDAGVMGALIVLRRAGGTEPYLDVRSKEDDCLCPQFPSGKIGQIPDEPFYRVVLDPRPETPIPTLANLDRLTLGIAEESGRTGTVADSSASGYAVRAMMIGGPLGPTRANDSFEIPEFVGERIGALPACWFEDRDLLTGVVERVRVTEAGVSASATGDSVNASTRDDLETPADRCRPVVAPPDPRLEGGLPVESQIVECIESGTEEATGTLRSSAKVACAGANRSAEGFAEIAPLTVGAVSVGRADVRSSISPDPEHGGLRAQAISTVHNIEIAGGLSIDLLISKATAYSNGRPDMNEAVSQTKACGISAPGQEPVTGCLPVEQAIPYLNRALAERGFVKLSEPDAPFLAGTPRGYLAGVTKNQFEVLEDQMIVRDYREEVPGLELMLYTDSNKGHARQWVRLAAVRAVVGYGVRCAVPFVLDAKATRCVEAAIEPEPTPTPRIVDRPLPPAPAVDQPEVPVPESPIDFVPPTATTEIVKTISSFIVRHVGDGFSGALVWLLLGAPVVLMTRRWAHIKQIAR